MKLADFTNVRFYEKFRIRRVRRERLQCLGNAVVPAQAEAAVRELVRRLHDAT